MSAEKKRVTKVAARKPAGKKVAKRSAPAAKAKKPAKKPAVKPKKTAAASAPAKPAPAAQKPVERRSFFSFLGFGGPRPAGKTKMTDLIKK